MKAVVTIFLGFFCFCVVNKITCVKSSKPQSLHSVSLDGLTNTVVIVLLLEPYNYCGKKKFTFRVGPQAPDLLVHMSQAHGGKRGQKGGIDQGIQVFSAPPGGIPRLARI